MENNDDSMDCTGIKGADSERDIIKRRISKQACDVFNDLRESGALCDVTIKCDGRDFHVHRIIMSGCSPYFRALFSNDLSESFKSEILIPNVSAADMELIIQKI
ncbi:kelch-like protein 10 [Lingula anatina]|uniref:Kelch-like protein 10 n=1 Tax=Lingula anatina TaxID=7574 RepID=A0A2R2MLU8_LINAN|nr:kelch-like protein 10 [Lingula anatina]|eukprot:XP_023931180.1 kelch-like protein 10 [Lingula anatina]